MESKPPPGRDRARRPPTITEQARRAQLISVTIEQVASHGYAGTSLARIATAAGISKATVLYHYPSKEAVVQAAYATVIENLTQYVGAAVESLTGAAALEAYARALVGYLRERPAHARMLIEAMVGDTGVTDQPNAASRWQTVADLIGAATATGEYRNDVDRRVVAVVVNGAIDAIVAERLTDAEFDSAHAVEVLVDLLRRALRR